MLHVKNNSLLLCQATLCAFGLLTGCGVSPRPGSGTSAPPASKPVLAFSPSSLAFGNAGVGSTSVQSASISNTGLGNAHINTVNVTGAFTISGLTAPLVLTPTASQSFHVSFAPTAAGPLAGTLSVISDAQNSPSTLALSGTGAQHEVDLLWTSSPSIIAGYRVYRGSQHNGPYALLTPSLVAATTYTDFQVSAGQTAFYVVTAVDGEGIESDYSPEASATVPSP